MTKRELPHIGWREWVGLPDLGIPSVKAKIDTGARSSALHAFDVEIFRRGKHEIVRFKVHPRQRDSKTTVTAEARLLERRHVRNSGGARALRPVIETPVEFRGERWPVELTLVSRDEMGFRMLLGRQAVRDRLLVDSGRSYLGGKPRAARKKKKKAKRKKKGKGEERP